MKSYPSNSPRFRSGNRVSSLTANSTERLLTRPPTTQTLFRKRSGKFSLIVSQAVPRQHNLTDDVLVPHRATLRPAP